MTETAACKRCNGLGHRRIDADNEWEEPCLRCNGTGREPSPVVPEAPPIPEDLRESYEALCRQAPKHPAIPLYERIARAEATIAELETQLAEADFDFGGWRATKRRLESTIEELTNRLRDIEYIADGTAPEIYKVAKSAIARATRKES